MTMPRPELPKPAAKTPAVEALCGRLLAQLRDANLPEPPSEPDPREEYDRQFGILVDPSRWEASVETREAA